METKKYKLGTYFPIRIVIFGYIGIVISILIAYSLQNWIFGLILLILPLFVCFTFQGVLIEQSEKETKIKEYFNYFGYKKGKWKAIDQYPFIAVLTRNVKYNVSSFGAQGATYQEAIYEINLLTASHRGKILLKRSTKKETITAEAVKIAKELGLELVTYNPAVSQKLWKEGKLRGKRA